MTEIPILYSFRRCPYAMRARMVLLASRQAVELREVSLRSKPIELLSISPESTVPVLELPNGRVVTESLDIMHWALAQNDPCGLALSVDAALIAANDGPFKHNLDRYKYCHRHGTDPKKYREKGLLFLTSLEARLSVSTNLCGASHSLTDIAIFPFVRQYVATDASWFEGLQLPHVAAWLDRHLASEIFEQAMGRVPQWVAGTAPVIFGGR